MGNTLINKLYEYDADADVELYALIKLFALDVMSGMKMKVSPETLINSQLYNICLLVVNFYAETVMGVSIDALSKPDSNYIKAVHE